MSDLFYSFLQSVQKICCVFSKMFQAKLLQLEKLLCLRHFNLLPNHLSSR